MSWSIKQIREIVSGIDHTVESYLKGAQHWDPVMAKIEDKVGHVSASSWGGLHVYVTSNIRQLADVWKELRLLGYATDYTEPTDEATNEREIKFTKTIEGVIADMVTLHFTSTVCKRVQVGTELKEVPVYELRCGEEEVANEAQV